jgi:hypothetical protein
MLAAPEMEEIEKEETGPDRCSGDPLPLHEEDA